MAEVVITGEEDPHEPIPLSPIPNGASFYHGPAVARPLTGSGLANGRPDRSSDTTSGVASLTANGGSDVYQGAMSNVTQAELVEMVPGLRALASVEASTEVRAALNRLAERYAAMAVGSQDPALATTGLRVRKP